MSISYIIMNIFTCLFSYVLVESVDTLSDLQTLKLLASTAVYSLGIQYVTEERLKIRIDMQIIWNMHILPNTARLKTSLCSCYDLIELYESKFWYSGVQKSLSDRKLYLSLAIFDHFSSSSLIFISCSSWILIKS